MADIISSLFGLSPIQEEIANKQRERQFGLGQLYGQATVNTNAPLAKQQAYVNKQAAQSALGGMAVRGLGSLFGVQDKELKRASDLEAILNQTQQEVGGDPTQLYPLLQQRLADAGYTREAMQVGQVGASQIQASQLNQAKVVNELTQAEKFKAEALKALREDDPAQKLFFEMAKNATPQSVARAIQNGYDLAMLDSPEKTKYSPLAQQLIDAGYQYGSPEFNAKMNELIDAEKTGKSKGSGNVNVSLGGIAIDSGKVSEEAGKIVGKNAAEIEDQYAALTDFEKAKEMLNKGIFAGPYGPTEMKIAKNTRQNLGKVANTEKFKAYVASNVIKRLKDIGGNDTKEERDYLESMVGGDITFEPSAIQAVIESGEQKIRDKIARTRTQVESAGKGTAIPLEPMVKDGTESVSKSGKPIIMRNGKWEYK